MCLKLFVQTMCKTDQAPEGFALVLLPAENEIDLLLLRGKIRQDHIVDELVRVRDGGQQAVA